MAGPGELVLTVTLAAEAARTVNVTARNRQREKKNSEWCVEFGT
jgi:hypothetical protein